MPDGQVRIIIRFDGHLDESRLRKAVMLAFDAEPVTGCRLVEKPVRLYWQRCPDIEIAYVYRDVDFSGHEEGVNDFLLAPLDLYNGPQARVGLFRSGFDTLIIKMSHIVADGGASMEYLRILSGIYRRLEKEPEYRPVINLRGSRSGFQVLKHVSLKKTLSASRHISASKSSWKLPETGDGQARPSFVIRRIGARRLSHIKAYSRERGVTIGDIVLTAYYRALFEAIDPQENIQLHVSVPVNLRKYIPGSRAEGLCSLSGAYFPCIVRKKDESFEETLARVHAAMDKNKSTQEELGQLFVMEMLLIPGYIAPRILNRFLSSVAVMPCYSNIGVVDPEIADFGEIMIKEIIPAGPMASPPNLTIGSSTFNGDMVLTASVLGTDAHRAGIESLFDAIVRELPGYTLNEVVTKTPVQAIVDMQMLEKYVSDA